MQSHNGDVELSVTLSTKGIESDTKKIKKIITDSVKQNDVSYSPKVDTKNIDKGIKEINKDIEKSEPTFKPNVELDTSKLDKLKKLYEPIFHGTVEESQQAQKIFNEIFTSLTHVEKDAFKQWEKDRITISRGNENTQIEINEVKDTTQDLTDAETEYLESIQKTNEELTKQNNLVEKTANITPTKKEESSQTVTETVKQQKQNVNYISRGALALQTYRKEMEFTNELIAQQKYGVIGVNEQFSSMLHEIDIVAKEFEKVTQKMEYMEALGDEESAQYKKLADRASQLGSVLHNRVTEFYESMGQIQHMSDMYVIDEEKANELFYRRGQALSETVDKSERVVNYVKQVKTALKDSESEAKNLAYDLTKFSEGFQYSDKFNQLKQDVSFLTKEFNSVTQKMHQMELLGETSSKKYQEMSQRANSIAQALLNANNQLQNMRENGTAFTEGINIEERDGVEKQFDTLATKLGLIQTESQNVGEQAGDMTDELSMAGDAAGAFGGHIGMIINIATKAIGIFKKVGSAIKQVGNFLNKTLITPIKKLASQVTKLLNPVKSLQKVTLSFRQVLGYALGIRGLFGVFSKLRSYITEGTQNLAKWRDGNNRANESLSTLTSTLQWMKNAWGAAFEPILTYVTPLLDTLISKVAETANAISFMLAKLTGQSTWMKAIRVQKDYAKSLSGTGGAAKDATQKLAQYDKLVVINQDNANGASSANADIDKMFEEVPIDDAIDWADNILDKLLEAWKKADFSDIGKLIGTRLKEWLDNIDWTSIKQWAKKFARSLATLLNGFFETEGLGTSIGKSLAEAFNTAFTFLDDFVHTLHWKSIGNFISETLLGFLDTFDAVTAGSAVGGLIRGFIDMIYTALDDFAENEGFEKIGQKIAEFITAGLEELSYIDLSEGGTGLTGWEEMGESITTAVHGLMTAISTAIQDLTDEGVFGELGRGIAQCLEKIDFTQFITDTGDLVKNIMEALSQALQGFTGTDNIADAIVKLIEDSVKNITITIAKIVFKITEIAFEESVPETISSVLNKMAGELTALHIVLGIVLPPLNNVLSVIENLIHAVGNLNILLKASPVLWQMIKKEAQSFWEGLSLYIDDIKFWLSDLWDNYLKPFSYWILEEFIPGLLIAIGAPWALLAYNISQFLVALDNVKEGIKTTINDIIPFVEDFFNRIIDGINTLLSSIGSIDLDFSGLPSVIQDKIGSGISFDLPTLSHVSIPRLASGAVIPPNKEFLAMLGDQNQGVNIETPLETMMEAFRAVLAENGSANNEPIVLQLNGKVIAQAVWDEERKKYKQTGSYAY